MKRNSDIIIAGGGIVGLTCALAISHKTGEALKITVLDASDPSEQLSVKFDGRASAIAASSWTLFEHLGIASALEGQVQPIRDILISDGDAGQTPSPLTLHFDSRDQNPNVNGSVKPMGMMAENRHVRAALYKALLARENIRLHSGAKVVDHTGDESSAEVTLTDGRTFKSKLLIAADGRNSQIRKRAGIETTGWDYAQMGIVTTVSHERPHEGVAHELFLPAGPFAILPLPDDEQGRSRSSIVWTDSARAAKAAKALPDALFEAELARRFGQHWGRVCVIAPRHIYPLGLQMAKQYTAARTVLVGDAAHAIHPIAGQGLNMGLRDVAALADVVSAALVEGRDIGDAQLLTQYESWRRFDNQLLSLATDIFNRAFSNRFAPLVHARRIGMSAVDRLAPARKFFIKEAAGETGTLPTLLQI